MDAEQSLQGIGLGPAAVEAAWSAAWTGLQSQGTPLTRIRTETMVVVIRRARPGLKTALATLTAHHPGRCIVVIFDRARAPSAHAELLPALNTRSVSELVTFRLQRDLARHWTEVVLPLLLPELPVYLWLPSPRVLALGPLRQMLESVNHVVLDSHGAIPPWEPWAGLWADRSEAALHDLDWSRTAAWRSVLAEAFDPPDVLPLLRHVATVEASGSADAESLALWLWAWMACQLDWRPEGQAGPPTAPSARPLMYRAVPSQRGLLAWEMGFTNGERLSLRRQRGLVTTTLVDARGTERVMTRRPMPQSPLGALLTGVLTDGLDPLWFRVMDWLWSDGPLRP